MIRSRSIRRSRTAAWVAIAAFALVSLTAIVACGGDDDGGATNVDNESGTPTGGPSATVPAGAAKATLLTDPAAFLDQYSQEVLDEKICDYDETNGTVDCSEAGAGLYELVPGLPEATDTECRVMLSRDTPVGLRCKGEDPLFAAVYELEE